jgi:hypothetical protein
MAISIRYDHPISNILAGTDTSIPNGRRNLDRTIGQQGTTSGRMVFDTSYPTGGYSVSKFGLASVGMVSFETDPVYTLVYDRTNDKVKVYTNSHTHTENTAAAYTQNATTVAANALVEVANATNLSALQLYFEAKGLV